MAPGRPQPEGIHFVSPAQAIGAPQLRVKQEVDDADTAAGALAFPPPRAAFFGIHGSRGPSVHTDFQAPLPKRRRLKDEGASSSDTSALESQIAHLQSQLTAVTKRAAGAAKHSVPCARQRQARNACARGRPHGRSGASSKRSPNLCMDFCIKNSCSEPCPFGRRHACQTCDGPHPNNLCVEYAVKAIQEFIGKHPAVVPSLEKTLNDLPPQLQVFISQYCRPPSDEDLCRHIHTFVDNLLAGPCVVVKSDGREPDEAYALKMAGGKTTAKHHACKSSIYLQAWTKGEEVCLIVDGPNKRQQLSIAWGSQHRVTACPRCFQKLELKFSWPPRAEASSAIVPARKKGGKGCAFVSVLWGESDTHLLDALVLGYSLRKHGVRHATVLLCTAEAMSSEAAKLLKLYWDVRRVDHVEARPEHLAKCKDRHCRVFTKLRAWRLEEYHRVCLLDTDTLLRRNVDEVFDFPVPCALFRGRHPHTPGRTRTPESMFNRSGVQQFGINAGVIIFEPDAQVHDDMCDWLTEPQSNRRDGVNATRGPEQDFLTRWFIEDWHQLNWKYNFQLHQVVQAAKDNDFDYLSCQRFEDVGILHFSTEWKPNRHVLEGSLDFHKCLGALLSSFRLSENVPVRQCVNQAWMAWVEDLRKAWLDVLERVVEGESLVQRHQYCPCCLEGFAHDSERDHAFFTCRATQQNMPHAIRGRLETTLGSYLNAEMLEKAVERGGLVPALHYVGAVHRLRNLDPHCLPSGDTSPANALFPHCEDGPHMALALESCVSSQTGPGRRVHAGGRGQMRKKGAGKNGFAAPPLGARIAHASAGPCTSHAQLSARARSLGHPPTSRGGSWPEHTVSIQDSARGSLQLEFPQSQPEQLPAFVGALACPLQKMEIGRVLVAELICGEKADEEFRNVANDARAADGLLERGKPMPTAAWRSLSAAMEDEQSVTQWLENTQAISDDLSFEHRVRDPEFCSQLISDACRGLQISAQEALQRRVDGVVRTLPMLADGQLDDCMG